MKPSPYLVALFKQFGEHLRTDVAVQHYFDMTLEHFTYDAYSKFRYRYTHIYFLDRIVVLSAHIRPNAVSCLPILQELVTLLSLNLVNNSDTWIDLKIANILKTAKDTITKQFSYYSS